MLHVSHEVRVIPNEASGSEADRNSKDIDIGRRSRLEEEEEEE